MNLFRKYKQTFLICLINLVVYLCLNIISIFKPNFPLYFSAWNFETGLFVPYQLISYQFIHANFNHLYFNMLFFVVVSTALEPKIQSPKILYYYLIFGFLAGLTHLFIDNQSLPLVGASGSVWGFATLYLLFTRSFFAKIFVLALFSFEVYMALIGAKDLIAHWCHLGGAVAGLLVWYFERKNFLELNN